MIGNTDLLINSDGSVYHLGLKPGDVGEIIFLVGDPDRVPNVSKYFDKIIFKNQRREICTHTGTIGNTMISCISTGMGTDNIDIVLNEVDALFNVDFSSREVKKNITKLKFIRLGTSGSLQKDILPGTIIKSEFAVGFDNLAHYYNFKNADEYFLNSLIIFSVPENIKLKPYIAKCDDELYEKFSAILSGITATCPGFYAPQSRNVRAENNLFSKNLLEKLSSFSYNEKRITNFEMETSGIYMLSEMLNHQAISLNAILANRALQTFDTDANSTIKKMIKTAFEILF